MADQLAAIEHKLDAVLAVLQSSEAANDRLCHHLAVNSPMANLATTWAQLMQRRSELHGASAADRAAPPQAPGAITKDQAAIAYELDQISDRLLALAHELVQLPAAGAVERAVKARVLIEHCEQNSDDIVHQLAASLAADLLADEPSNA